METKELSITTKTITEKTSEWTKDHDVYLRSLVEMYGDSDWHIVAECMNNKFKECFRTGKDCRNHWKSYLDTTGPKQSWNDRERYLLLVAHQKYKNRWSEVARMLRKQSSNLIKNRFYTLFRKIRNRIKNNDLITTSPLDLLEIYYVLTLIEQYHATLPEKTTVEYAEKNYAHKLVQQIDKDKVADYKAKVLELHKGEGTMAELFEKYATVYITKQPETVEENIITKSVPECKEIDFADNENEEEVKIKITLPSPNTFSNSDVMTDEEKDAFWKSAFLSKEPKSDRVQVKSAAYDNGSVASSVFSQTRSAGPMAMRDDEYFGFSQFATPFESEEARPAVPKFPNHLLPPSAASFGGTINTPVSPSPTYAVQLPIPPVPPKLPSLTTATHSPFQPLGPPSAFQYVPQVNSGAISGAFFYATQPGEAGAPTHPGWPMEDNK